MPLHPLPPNPATNSSLADPSTAQNKPRETTIDGHRFDIFFPSIHYVHFTQCPPSDFDTLTDIRQVSPLHQTDFLSGPPRTGPSLNTGPPHSTRHSMARPAGPLSHASRHGTRPDPDTCPHYSPAHRLSVRTGPPPRLRLGSRPRYPARHTPTGLARHIATHHPSTP